MRLKIGSGSSVGKLRNSNAKLHSAGTVLIALPPLIVLVWAVVNGTSYWSSNGPRARNSSATSRMKQIRRAAYSIAFTPCGVSDECAATPRTQQLYVLMPLCAMIGRMLVGSPTQQPSGATTRLRNSAIISGAPAQPTSSSNESAKWMGLGSFVACLAG